MTIACVGFGLTIATDIALPGTMTLPDTAAGTPDIEIGWGTAVLDGVTTTLGPYRARDRDGFVFALPGVATYTCHDRRRIVVERDPGADDAAVAAMLIATVLPALLWARGDVVLHAAAAMLPDGHSAVAAAGASGSGKSTLLMRAMAHGARSIGDDTIRVRLVDGVPVASGLPGGCFGPLAGADAERPFHAFRSDRQLADGALGMLLVFEPGGAAARRLDPLAAMRAVLLHRHRHRIAHLLRLEAETLPVIAAIVRDVPLVSVGRDRLPGGGWADTGFPSDR